jgi:hypothetical protein
MANRCELYGHPIIDHRRLTYAQQIYQIFVEEIHNGRWAVGKRLPGVAAIIAKTGFGNKTIQDAFKMLKDAGYVRAEPYKGTFLVSLVPQGLDSSKGRVGILLSESRASEPYALWLSHILMDGLKSRGMVGEVRIVDPERQNMQNMVSSSGPFTKDVKAVISLVPFSQKPRFEQGDAALPVIFFSTAVEDCAPLLAVDVERGYYELTRRVIHAGHKNVAFFADDSVSEKITELYRQGYSRGMRECGLEPVEYITSHDNPATVVRLFRKLIAGGKITAVVSGSLAIVQNLFSMKDFSELVPDRISIVSIGSDRIPGEEDMFVTGVSLNFDYMLQSCFDLLNELMTTGRCRRSKVLMMPDFVSGNTLRNLGGLSSEVSSSGLFSKSGAVYSAKQFSAAASRRV